MPSLRQLQYLVDLHDTGNFRLAAERSGVSQPTLSAQIQTLERRLGAALVERQRTPVLTPAGRAILPLARDVVQSVQRMQDIVKSHAGGRSGTVRLGVPISIGPHLLPAFIPVLHRRCPGLRLYVREALPASLPDGLASGMHDVLIAPMPVRGAGFETLPLFREPLLLAVPEEHPLAARTDVSAAELAGLSVLALEQGHALKEQVEAICTEHGASLLHDFEGTSLSTLHQMVASGLGVTFLPAMYVHAMPAGAGIKLLRLTGKPLHRSVGMVWRSGSPLAPTYRLIAEHLALHVRQLYADFTVLLTPQAAA